MRIRHLFSSRMTSAFLLGIPLLLAFNNFSLSPAPWTGIAHEGRDKPEGHPPRQDESLRPSPQLSPEQVITIQLEALQHNDTPTKDSGIATTFKFASPANLAATGPLDHFIEMVKNPVYRPMLNHQRAERGPLKTTGDLALQKVTLFTAEGKRVVYVFALTKQHEAPYKGCWMTDSVVRLSNQEEEREEKIAQSNGHSQGKRQA